MRGRFLLGASLVAGVLAAAPVRAAESAAPVYTVSIKLHDGDRLVGEPRLKVIAGATTQIEIRDAEGHGFSMTMVARPQSDTTVGVSSTIDATSITGFRQAIQPTLVVKLGQDAAIAFGQDSDTQKPFRVNFTVEQAAL